NINAKLAAKYSEPLIVTKIIDKVIVEVANSLGKTYRVHVKDIRAYQAAESTVTEPANPPEGKGDILQRPHPSLERSAESSRTARDTDQSRSRPASHEVNGHATVRLRSRQTTCDSSVSRQPIPVL
ncbi:hypothetical protein PV326_008849, partial [Microctonus aethiopoides]